MRILAPRLFNQKWVTNFSKCVERPISGFLTDLSSGSVPQETQQRISDSLEDQTGNPLSSDDIEEEDGDHEEEEFWETDDREFTTLSSIDDAGKAFRYVQGLVNRYILQRTKNDPCVRSHLPPIPEPIYETIPWKMDPAQQAFYSAIENDFLESGRRKNYLKLVDDLNVICNAPSLNPIVERKLSELEASGAPARRVGFGKIDALCKKAKALLTPEGSNHRILIFVHRIEVARRIKAELDSELGGDVQFVSGEDPVNQREIKINLARDGIEPHQRVLIITDGVGSEGLCLPEFESVFSFDMPWNPGKWSQQIARAYRIGQKRQVTIYEFACTNNMGAKLDIEKLYKEMYAIKAQTVSGIFGTNAQGLLRLIMPVAEVSMEELLRTAPEASNPFEEGEDSQGEAREHRVSKLETVSVEELAQILGEYEEWDEEDVILASSARAEPSSFISSITAARQLFEGQIRGEATGGAVEDEGEDEGEEVVADQTEATGLEDVAAAAAPLVALTHEPPYDSFSLSLQPPRSNTQEVDLLPHIARAVAPSTASAADTTEVTYVGDEEPFIVEARPPIPMEVGESPPPNYTELLKEYMRVHRHHPGPCDEENVYRYHTSELVDNFLRMHNLKLQQILKIYTDLKKIPSCKRSLYIRYAVDRLKELTTSMEEDFGLEHVAAAAPPMALTHESPPHDSFTLFLQSPRTSTQEVDLLPLIARAVAPSTASAADTTELEEPVIVEARPPIPMEVGESPPPDYTELLKEYMRVHRHHRTYDEENVYRFSTFDLVDNFLRMHNLKLQQVHTIYTNLGRIPPSDRGLYIIYIMERLGYWIISMQKTTGL